MDYRCFCPAIVYSEKISKELISHIGKRVSLHSPEELGSALDKLGKAGANVQVCADTTSSWIYQRLSMSGANIYEFIDPVVLPKAIKNDHAPTRIRQYKKARTP